MTATERFIRKAVDGGYDLEIDAFEQGILVYQRQEGRYKKELRESDLLLDADLWRCAGKSLGWGKYPKTSELQGKTPWYIHWHGLLNYLAIGKTADEYLASLLTD